MEQETPKKPRLIFSLKINKNLLQFLFLFISLLALFYFSTIQFENYVPIFNMQTTSSTLFQFLQVLGLQATLDSNQINVSTFALSIVRQCTGLFEAITLTAAVIAYPTNIKNKIKGIALGLPLIYFFNIVRLVFLAFLGVYYFSLFEIVHDYILQITFFSFVIFIWFFWLNLVVRKNASV